MRKLLMILILTTLMIACTDKEVINHTKDSNSNDNDFVKKVILENSKGLDEEETEDPEEVGKIVDSIIEDTENVVNKIDDIAYIELKEEMVVNSRLRVRKGPSIEYDYFTIDYYVNEDKMEELSYLLIGSRVTVSNRTSEMYSVGEDKHYWYEITYTSETNQQIEGWVYGLYLTPFLEEAAEIYSQKLSYDKMKCLLSDQLEYLGLDKSKDISLYWHHDKYSYMVLVLADESSDLISTGTNYEVYLINTKKDFYIEDKLEEIPLEFDVIEIVEMTGSFENGINFVHNYENNATFALWHFNSRNFSFLVESTTSLEGAYDELVSEFDDGTYDSVLSSKGSNNQYATSTREHYDLALYIEDFYSNACLDFVKDYLALTKKIFHSVNPSESNIMEHRSMIKEVSVGIPLLHPRLVEKNIDELTYKYRFYLDTCTVNIYDGDDSIAEFRLRIKRSGIVIENIEYDLEDEKIVSKQFDHLKVKTINLNDFENAGYDSYLRYGIKNSQGVYKINTDLDFISDLVFYVNEDYWFIEYKDSILKLNMSGHLYGEESICLADLNDDGLFDNIFIETDRYEPRTSYILLDIDEESLSIRDYLYSGIIYVSDGLLYLWETQMRSHISYDIETVKDLSTGYYDYKTGQYLENPKFKGTKKIWKISDTQTVFDIYENVPTDVYTIEGWKKEEHEDEIVGYLHNGDSYTVIDVIFRSDYIKVELSDGTQGWIGGFHAHWD